MNVQHWLEEPPEEDDGSYETVACKACGRLHLINQSSGKLLGEASE
jgi:hypothetical protein